MSTGTLSNYSFPQASIALPMSSSDLAAAVGIGLADRVLVVGRNVIDHVVALVQAGCHSVSSLCADLPYSRRDPLDVLWLSGINNVHDRVQAALNGASIPRLIVVEIQGQSLSARFLPVIRQLRTKGFVRFTAHRTVMGLALVAMRPVWLQQVH